ncbi:MAG: acyl-CoA dehydrogenase family protein, partial [Proteobacteria bacterium]|nr:acyl-CoA dehydrogenase family protein [Pseudomonadota bacterium]
MNLNDSTEEAAFRSSVYDWLRKNAELWAPGEIPTSAADREDPSQIKAAQEWQAKKFDAGWACITWPKEFGGHGGTTMEDVIWQQEEAKFRVPPEIFTIGIGMAAPTIMHYGTEQQKEQWLPKCARGDEIWCQLFSEPSA